MSARKKVISILFCFGVTLALIFSLAGHLNHYLWIGNALAQFQHIAFFAALLFLALALLNRVKPAIILSLLLLLSSGAALAPLMWHELQAPKATGASVKIINYNVLSYSPHQEIIAAWIREQQPDVIALVEANYRWVDTVASLKDILPYETHIDHRSNHGMYLLSHYPLENIQHIQDIPRIFPTIEADIALPIGKVRFIIAHDVTPMNPATKALQNLQLADYAEWVARSPLPVVLMGDFNTAPWTKAYYEMVLNQQLYGSKFSPSWPNDFYYPLVPIDQIVAGKGAVVSNITTGPAHHSDHRARVAQLRLAD